MNKTVLIVAAVVVAVVAVVGGVAALSPKAKTSAALGGRDYTPTIFCDRKCTQEKIMRDVAEDVEKENKKFDDIAKKSAEEFKQKLKN